MLGGLKMEKCPMKKVVNKIEYDEKEFSEDEGGFIKKHHTAICVDFGDCTIHCAAYDYSKGCRLIRRT